MNEMRYLMTRLVGVSYLLGINCAIAGYFMGLGRLRWYVSAPTTFVVFFLSRNLVMKNCIDKVYYPVQPLYQQVWKSHKAKTVSEISQSEVKKIAERDDLSLEDKKKASEKVIELTEITAKEDALREVEASNL